MLLFFFLYGTKHYKVRIGSGRRPLVYAAYKYDDESSLPEICGQVYREISMEQWDWLGCHAGCDVIYNPGFWSQYGDLGGTLYCKEHKDEKGIVVSRPIYNADLWEDREV